MVTTEELGIQFHKYKAEYYLHYNNHPSFPNQTTCNNKPS